MRFIISGNGELAEKITKMAGERGDICSSFKAFQKDPLTFVMHTDVVVIHVGDGEELPALVQTCREKGWPLIHSSGDGRVVKLPDMRGVDRYSATGYVRPSRYFELAKVLLH